MGGARPYGYRWLKSTDGNHYTSIAGETDSIYTFSDVIYETTYLRLESTSSYGCGTDTSNVLIVKMNPLPTLPDIIGDSINLCAKQQDVEYRIDHSEDGIAYKWTVDNGTITSSDTLPSVLISWMEETSSGTIHLLLKNKVTGCQNSEDVNVDISTTYSAPPKTHIMIKSGASILICADTTHDAHYMWGYTNKQTHEDIVIPNSDCRYIKLPESIDTITYDYFVDVRYGDIPCVTRTYYSRDEQDDDWWSDGGGRPEMTVMPNPSRGEVFYMLDTNIDSNYWVLVYDVYGKLILSEEHDTYVEGIPIRLNTRLVKGLYLISININNTIVSQKIIVE